MTQGRYPRQGLGGSPVLLTGRYGETLGQAFLGSSGPIFLKLLKDKEIRCSIQIHNPVLPSSEDHSHGLSSGRIPESGLQGLLSGSSCP